MPAPIENLRRPPPETLTVLTDAAQRGRAEAQAETKKDADARLEPRDANWP